VRARRRTADPGRLDQARLQVPPEAQEGRARVVLTELNQVGRHAPEQDGFEGGVSAGEDPAFDPFGDDLHHDLEALGGQPGDLLHQRRVEIGSTLPAEEEVLRDAEEVGVLPVELAIGVEKAGDELSRVGLAIFDGPLELLAKQAEADGEGGDVDLLLVAEAVEMAPRVRSQACSIRRMVVPW
jgi:hypothetical protein